MPCGIQGLSPLVLQRLVGWASGQTMPIAAFAILCPKARPLFRILGVLKQRPLSTVVEMPMQKHCVECLF